MALISLRHRRSIGAKLFAAFIAMSLLTAALGGYGLYVLVAAGRIVVDTYDGPLMAINFARSASFIFAQLEKETLRRAIAPAEARADIDRGIEALTSAFHDDLAVARERALADDERRVIAEITSLFEQWSERRHTDTDLLTHQPVDALARRIVNRFDVLIELIAGHTFVERRKAVWSISYFEYTSIAGVVLALLLSGAITWLLARRIVRPLAAAAAVAERIAGGELQTPIPTGGSDETGTLLRTMTVMQDNIRVMMERETAQRQSAQSRLIDALESTREGMILVDAEGRIAIANSQVATFFPSIAAYLAEGSEFASVLRILRQQFLYQDAGDDSDSSTATLDGGAVSFVGECLLADGRWVRISRSATRDGGFFLFMSDFTDIKEREERFKEAMRKAETASAAKTNFLTNMSHELRTPLNAIIGFSELISQELLGKLGHPKYAEYAADILNSGRHLLDVINSVLDLAKSEAGKLELKPQPIDLDEIVEACAAMMRDQCARAGLGFDVQPPAAPVRLMADAAKLRQIVLNLLSNAVKFTDPGGTVRLAAAGAADGGAVICVCDTGIGMSADDIAIALTPFGQVDSRLARRYEGTGLGLPLTKALAALHGGKLEIDSEPGRGTTVTVTIPPGEAAPQQDARVAAAG